MTETTMPAAEAEAVEVHDDERNLYEFAFHVLPTVAEGEVPAVFEALKTNITNAQGEITSEEAPERIDLVYDIVESLDGKNRKFSSAYFGWVRFKAHAGSIEGFKESVEENNSVLRYLITKLTKAEEENPYFFHEMRKKDKQVKDVVEADISDAEVNKEESSEKEEKKEEAEVKEEEKTEEAK